eukprot:5702817-Pleurochrysis_carterae.AAC.2
MRCLVHAAVFAASTFAIYPTAAAAACLNTTLGFDYTRQPAHLSRPPSNSECARHMIGELIDNMWALSCGLGLSNNLVALFISTVTVITGPGMALRGPEGSLGVAIAHMERQARAEDRTTTASRIPKTPLILPSP